MDQTTISAPFSALLGAQLPASLSARAAAALAAPQEATADFSAMLSAQNDLEGDTVPPEARHANARGIAEEFEAVFLNTMLSQMFSGLKSPEPFGGGHAEQTYRGLMVEEYAKAITENGGVGIADAIERQLIELQEANSA